MTATSLGAIDFDLECAALSRLTARLGGSDDSSLKMSLRMLTWPAPTSQVLTSLKTSGRTSRGDSTTCPDDTN